MCRFQSEANPSDAVEQPLLPSEFVNRLLSQMRRGLREKVATIARRLLEHEPASLGYFEVLANSTNIMLVSGLAGALFVKQFGFAAPSLIGFGLSTEVLIWVAVGGRNVLLAAFLGALLVRAVEGALSDRLGNYWLLALGVFFIVTVVLMPSGLFGRVLMPQVPPRLRGER